MASSVIPGNVPESTPAKPGNTHSRRALPIALCCVMAAAMALAGVFMFLPDRSEATAEYWEEWTELGNLANQSRSGTYKVTTDTAITAGSGQNGITITGDTTIYIAKDVTLRVTGGAGNSTTGVGGGAGIYLPDGWTLYLRGEGGLIATGGAGGAGRLGGDSIKASGTTPFHHAVGTVTAGAGGAGGVGGGGAGAGVGSRGGDGGSGTSGGGGSIPSHPYNSETSSTLTNSGGGGGSVGAPGAVSVGVGDLYVLDAVNVTARGGARGGRGAGGSIANSDPRGNGSSDSEFGPTGQWAQTFRDTYFYLVASGGGGGGGGSGGAAANIGSGGAGGGRGGGGGSGGYYYFHLVQTIDDIKNPDYYSTGGGGRGGYGWGDNGNGLDGAGGDPRTYGVAGGTRGGGGQRGEPSTDGGMVYIGEDASVDADTPSGPGKIGAAGNATSAGTPNERVTEYTLTYNANGGELGPVQPTQTYPAAIPNQYVTGLLPIRTGYTCVGWSGDEDAEKPGYTPGAPLDSDLMDADKTLYAVWKADIYTIELDNGGGSGEDAVYLRYDDGWYSDENAEDAIGYEDTGDAVTPPTLAGYTFGGYYTSQAGGEQYLNASGRRHSESVPPNTAFTSHGALYARYTPNHYTADFYYNAAVDDNSLFATQAAIYDTDYNYPVPTRAGFTFMGWNDGRSGPASTPAGTTDKTYRNLSAVDGDTVELYALWKLDEYRIEYDDGGADVAEPRPDGKYTYLMDSVTLAVAPVPTGADANLIFIGWEVTKPAIGGPGFDRGHIYQSGWPVADMPGTYGNVVLIAKWVDPEGMEIMSEDEIDILEKTFENKQTYVRVAVDTYVDGAPASVDSVDLRHGNWPQIPLSGVGGRYAFIAEGGEVSDEAYDVYVNGRDTGLDVYFAETETPTAIDVYFYSVTVTLRMDDVEANAGTLSLTQGADEISLVPDADRDGVYMTTQRVDTLSGSAIDLWNIIVDGADSDKDVAFAQDLNNVTIDRYTLRIETALDGVLTDLTDSLGAVLLKASEGPDIVPTGKSPGVYGRVGFAAPATYEILVGGSGTGQAVAFSTGEYDERVDYYTIKIETYVDGAPADVGNVTMASGGAVRTLTRGGAGRYALVGQADATGYAVSVNGVDIGQTASFTPTGREARADFFTAGYQPSGDTEETGAPPTDGTPHISGGAFNLLSQHTLAWTGQPGHTFAGWREQGGGAHLYKPGELFEDITKPAVFIAVWSNDDDAEARWTAVGEGVTHYGLLAEALDAAQAPGAAVGITLRKDSAVGYTAQLGPDDSLTTDAHTLTIASGGSITNGGLIDNAAGKVVVEDGGKLYNDNELASADTNAATGHLSVEAGGYAASRVAFEANGQGTAPPGNTEPIDHDYIAFNEPIPDSYVPENQGAGYSFTGWYLEAAGLNPWAMGAGGNPVTNALTLYASWNENHYDVTFYGGGRGADPQKRDFSVTHGAVLGSVAPGLVSEGWRLEGWYPDTAFTPGQEYDLGAPVTGPLEAHAHWLVNGYTVSFDLTGHPDATPAPEDADIAFGANVTEPTPRPAVAGFDLTGWYRDDTFTEQWDFEEDTMPATAITLYAGWRAQDPVRVGFDLNGHSGTTPAAVYATPGATLSYPLPVPVSDEPSVSFAGWYRQPECYAPWNFGVDTVPPNDMTLYAGWQDDAYTVTFNLNGVSADRVGDAPPPQRADDGETVMRPDPDPKTPGYGFGGWYRDKACNIAWDFATDVVTGDMPLFAKWTAKKYDVAFNDNGHPSASPMPPAQNVTYGALAARPDPAPADAGFMFLGWYTTSASIAAEHRWGFASDTMGAGNMTLYAGWRSDTAVRVNFNMNGHGEPVPDDQWVEPEGAGFVARPAIDPVAEGYAFGDWYEDKACTDGKEWVFGGGGTEVPTSGAVVYAKWTAGIHTASFDLNAPGGATPGPQPDSYSAPYGVAITEPAIAPAAAGYTFLGWYRDTAAKDRWVFANDTMPAGDVILYAGWREDGSLKVLFDANLPAGAALSGPAIDAVWVMPGSAVPEPAPAPEAAGQTFGGWYRDAACTPGQKWDFAGARMDAAMTLYAKWAAAPCTVYFDTGGKSKIQPAPAIVDPGGLVPVPETPTAPALVLKGWYAMEGYGMSETPWFFPGDTVPPVTSLVLTAQWAPEDSRKVSFDLNTAASSGGFIGNPSNLATPATQWLLPGAWVDEPDGPGVGAEGQYISGWYTTNAAVTPADRWDFTDTTVGAVDVKLYAQWAQRPYEAYYEANGHGSVTTANPAVAAYGALLAAPTVSAAAGWNLTAWYEDVSLKKPWGFATKTMAAKDVTLYAGWRSSAGANLVEFNANGHGTTPAAVYVEQGGWLDEPEPGVAEEGWTFGGWYKDAAYAEKWDFATDTVTANPTGLYAKWTRNKYDVGFDASGYGKAVPAPYSGKHGFGETIPEPTPEPTQPGYVFDGWYRDEFTSGQKWDFATTTMPAIDITLYATWAKGKFTATFDLNGHGAQAPPPQTVTFGDKVAEPAQPSDADWAFGGWFKDAACSPGAEWDFAKDTMPGGSITLYAKWTTDIHAYTVFFVMNGHGGSAPNPVRVTAGQRIPEPARPYDTNWAFGGWFTNMACSPGYEWNFATGTMPNSDMTLFAKWTEDSSGGGGNGGGSGGNNDKGKDKDKDKDKNKDSDKDKNSGKDNGRGKGNAGSNSSGSGGAGNGSGAGGGSGENGDDSNAEGGGGENGGSSNAEGGGEGTADGAIDGIAGDDDTYGEAGADNASGEGSEWNTNGGSAEAGDEENDQGGRSDEPMSVANILLMVAGVVIALRVATEARKRRYAKWPPPTIIALGAAGAILYFAIERIHSSWAITNSHTIYFAIIIAAQIAATIIARRSKVAG